MLPVLLVPGIWDTGAKLQPMADVLASAGAPRALSMSISQSDGSLPILDAAREVAAAAATMGDRIDLVGFSMGALITRAYVQRLGGKTRVRRYVSIAGPHGGTRWAAFARPELRGVADMRPASPLLADLARDEDPWGDVEVHTIWTPFDLMIVPPRSSHLPGAKSETQIPVAVHRWLVTDARVLTLVTRLLTAA